MSTHCELPLSSELALPLPLRFFLVGSSTQPLSSYPRGGQEESRARAMPTCARAHTRVSARARVHASQPIERIRAASRERAPRRRMRSGTHVFALRLNVGLPLAGKSRGTARGGLHALGLVRLGELGQRARLARVAGTALRLHAAARDGVPTARGAKRVSQRLHTGQGGWSIAGATFRQDHPSTRTRECARARQPLSP